MLLESLGATEFVYRAFASYAAQDLVLARVAASNRDQYRLYAETGELTAEPSGALWHRTPDRADMPVTGDWVAARSIGATDAIVEAVLPRTTVFSRRAAGRREDQQPIAANIDLVFLVCGLDGDFNLRRMERYLALAAESRVEPVIVLNKSDLCGNLAARIAEARAVAAGATVTPASTRTANGMDAVRAFLAPGRTAALLGSSGVGKSSMINSLMGEDRLRTGEVLATDGRGRHTTTVRELILLTGCGVLIDTPGMRELQLWAGEASVEAVFDDVGELAKSCRYGDCTHTVEVGCAVMEAIADGTLPEERLSSYRKLIGEARWHETLSNPLAARERKQKWKALHKAARAYYRRRD